MEDRTLRVQVNTPYDRGYNWSISVHGIKYQISAAVATRLLRLGLSADESEVDYKGSRLLATIDAAPACHISKGLRHALGGR